MQKTITVGFTYDLKDDYLAQGMSPEAAAEFDSPETIAGISQALTTLGYQVDRIGNVQALLQRLSMGHRWDLVFNICEGIHGVGREAQVPAILDIFQIPYVFSDVLVMALTLHKGMTKHVLRDYHIPTPAFIVADDLRDLDNHPLKFPLFVKPVAEGTGKGIGADSRVENQQDLLRVCADRFQRFGQSLLIEEYLPGREFTVGVVGNNGDTRVIGMMEIIYKAAAPSKIYSYENKLHYEKYIEYRVPEPEVYKACEKVVLDAWKALKCADGGRMDLRMDAKGLPNFIEVNPLPGLNPIHSDLPILARKAGISYEDLLGLIMQAAVRRLGLKTDNRLHAAHIAKEMNPAN